MKNILFLLVVLASANAAAQNNYHTRSALDPALEPFYHGVASGDPLNDAVIIWTRITPDGTVNPGDSVQVDWRMATDTAMTQIVASGTAYTSDASDYTLKIDVTGLQPYTCYYFDFFGLGKYSRRGRTRTAPTGDNDSVRIAVVSCSNYENGYFNSYAAIVERNDVDAVLHLGDYLYEYAAGSGVDGRTEEPANEIISLSDYRTRYSHYRLDPDCREVHSQYPFITVWDDHESANNSWMNGAENHDPGTEGPWGDRLNNATQAYLEWLPIRENPSDTSRLYRKIEYGDLVNIYMLDTRIEGRDEQVAATSSDIDDPNRSILGDDQMTWLKNELSASTAKWNVIGQQVMMAPLEVFGIPVNADQWDGYRADRNELRDHIMNNGIENVVVLTGDIHTSWANDLPGASYNAGAGTGAFGVEFVTTSVTSSSSPIGVGTGIITAANPHMQWIDLTEKGYMTIDMNKNRTQCDWWFVDNITTQSPAESLGNSYFTNDGDNHLVQASQPAQRDVQDCSLAPGLPIVVGIEEQIAAEVVIVGAYPNPFDQEVIVQYNMTNGQNVTVEVLDAMGKIVWTEQRMTASGLNYVKIDGTELSGGMYTFVIRTDKWKATQRIVRL